MQLTLLFKGVEKGDPRAWQAMKEVFYGKPKERVELSTPEPFKIDIVDSRKKKPKK